MNISKLLSRPKFYLDLISTLNALLIIIIGILVLIGWHFNISILTSFNEEFVSMKANTAISFLISGILLFLLHHQYFLSKVIVRILAAAITLIGVLTLLQYTFGFNIGIDELFYNDFTVTVGTSHPGRMAPNTAFNFVLIGLAFYLFTLENFHKKSIIVFLIVTPITISLLSIAGYVLELTELTGLVSYTQMALHTSVTFILVCSGLFISTFNQWEAYSTTENKLLAGLTSATIVIIFVSILSISGIQSLLTESGRVENTRIINNIFNSLYTDVIEIQAAERGYLLAGEDSYLTTHKKSIDAIPELFDQLNLFENDITPFEKKIDLLGNMVQARIDYSYQVISLVRTKGLREARLLFASGKGKNLTDSIRALILSIIVDNDDLLKKRGIIEASQAYRIKQIILLSILIQILLISVILFIINKDITGRRKAERLLHKLNEELEERVNERTLSLSKSEERFRSTLDNMLEGCQIIGFDWKYIYINDAAEKHYRRPKDELIGKRYMDMWPGIEETEVFGFIKRCMEERINHQMDNEFIFPDGSPGWFELSIQAVPEGVFILSHDISERKLAEMKILKLNEELEQKVIERTSELETVNKELEAFSYSVSHDLRAPLRHIDGFIKMLQSSLKEKLDEKSIRYLGIISSAAKQMGQLIDDLLHFSRMNRTEIHYSLVDMNKMVNEVKEEIMSTIMNRNIEWKISNLPGIQTDPSMIRVVWMNLISNAVKYTSKVEKPIITIDTQRNENEITFIVKDNGAGFDSNYSHKLFGVFQRLHSAEEYEGTGIGLATVKRIVSRQGGNTWAEGELGKGATFYFSLPIKNY